MLVKGKANRVECYSLSVVLRVIGGVQSRIIRGAKLQKLYRPYHSSDWWISKFTTWYPLSALMMVLLALSLKLVPLVIGDVIAEIDQQLC